MKKILSYFFLTGLLLASASACGDDSLLNKIKGTENFKNADAVFMGKVTEIHGQGPVECKPVTGHECKPGKRAWYAQITVKKVYKGMPGQITVVRTVAPYLDSIKPDYKPLMQKGENYLIFGKIEPRTLGDDFIVNLFKFQVSDFYFSTSKEMGTINSK